MNHFLSSSLTYEQRVIIACAIFGIFLCDSLNRLQNKRMKQTRIRYHISTISITRMS